MNRNYNYGNANTTGLVNSIARKNIREYAKGLKFRITLCIAGIFIGFFSFGTVGFLSVSNMNSPFPWVFIPMFVFMLSGILTGVTFARYNTAKNLVSILDQIEASDKILIKNISFGSFFAREADILYAVKALMRCDLLRIYEIVDDEVVVKKSLNYKSGGAAAASIAAEKPKPQAVNNSFGASQEFIFCGECGAKNRGDTKFCQKCGAEIKIIDN